MSDPLSNPLESLSIASPCTADWDGMSGTDRVRFCGSCQLNVYNLSAMSRDEAETLVQNTEGRLCVRFFRRADGTVITKDCPVGLRALRKRKIKRLSRFAAAVTLVTVAGSFCISVAATRCNEVENEVKMGKPAVQPPTPNRALMGDIALPQPSQPAMGNVAVPPPAQAEQGRPQVQQPTQVEQGRPQVQQPTQVEQGEIPAVKTPPGSQPGQAEQGNTQIQPVQPTALMGRMVTPPNRGKR